MRRTLDYCTVVSKNNQFVANKCLLCTIYRKYILTIAILDVDVFDVRSFPALALARLLEQEGFNEAFKLSCADLCSLHGTGRPVPSHLGKACDKR